MITTAEIARSVAGAWRLARLDPAGLKLFDDSVEGFWRSFWAAAIVAPGFFYLVAGRIAGAHDGAIHAVLIEVAAYVVGWVAYPVAAHYLTGALNCGERYLVYIVAYNWAAVIQIAAHVVTSLVADSALMPEAWGVYFAIGVTALLWFYAYFIARTALQIPAAPAIALVACDVLISAALELALLNAHGVGG